MSKIKSPLFSFPVILLASCSNQQTYEAVQQNRLQECQKLPPTAAEKCIEQHNQSYEDYKQNREELLRKNDNIRRTLFTEWPSLKISDLAKLDF